MAQPRSVALVVGPSTGGIGRHVLSLIGALTTHGVRVAVYCPPATASRFQVAATGAQVTPVAIGPGPMDLVRLRRGLRAGAVDVVHAHGLRAGLAAELARPADLPFVVTWHTVPPSAGVRRLTRAALARTVARAADVTLAVSAEIGREAVAAGAQDVRLSMVVAPPLPPPGRDRAELLEELGLPLDAPLVLSVGRLHEHKRHDLLIAAAARWRDLHPVPSVVIAGTGPAYRDLVAQALTSRAPVSLVGYRTDVADLLPAADIAVVTSDGEGSPLFVQEALTTGVPLVATAVNGIAELVGDAAVLVPPDDADAVDAAVRELLADPGRRAVLAAAGRARAATWPTARMALDGVIAVYAELTGRGEAVAS